MLNLPLPPLLTPPPLTHTFLPPSCPPGSPPSVCLCAAGAACYLDDLVREGERDFISCLPEGLWYLWCCKAALLKRKRKSRHKKESPYSFVAGVGSQGLSRVELHLECLGEVPFACVYRAPTAGAPPCSRHNGVSGFVFRDTAVMIAKGSAGVREHFQTSSPGPLRSLALSHGMKGISGGFGSAVSRRLETLSGEKGKQ